MRLYYFTWPWLPLHFQLFSLCHLLALLQLHWPACYQQHTKLVTPLDFFSFVSSCMEISPQSPIPHLHIISSFHSGSYANVTLKDISIYLYVNIYIQTNIYIYIQTYSWDFLVHATMLNPLRYTSRAKCYPLKRNLPSPTSQKESPSPPLCQRHPSLSSFHVQFFRALLIV